VLVKGAAKCRNKCPAGCNCCLSGDINHTLHLCNDSMCGCHTKARYYGKPIKEQARVSSREMRYNRD